MKYDRIDSKMFIENRKRFAAKMEGNSIAIFQSNDQMPRSADSTHFFRQNPDLFYEKLTVDQAKEVSGVKTVVWIDEFDSILGVLMNKADKCYLNLNEHDRSVNKVPDRDLRFAKEMRERYPLHDFVRAAPLTEALRSIKSATEVELIQTACNITEKAFRRVLKFTKPGVYEYEREPEMMHEFLRNRATNYAYYPIIASGKDSCILHYNNNNKMCVDGDVLLLDFGAEYANYASDMTRTIPVNGRFSDRQRKVYKP